MLRGPPLGPAASGVLPGRRWALSRCVPGTVLRMDRRPGQVDATLESIAAAVEQTRNDVRTVKTLLFVALALGFLLVAVAMAQSGQFG
jgi:hypothetical protein